MMLWVYSALSHTGVLNNEGYTPDFKPIFFFLERELKTKKDKKRVPGDQGEAFKPRKRVAL